MTVENVAIIERAQLAPGVGFSVLTGETGAGKSLLIDAIELALGERADSDLVRHGASRASVSAVFDLSQHPDLLEHCKSLGFELEEGVLYIQREVYAEGRSQARVGGKLAPIGALKQIGRLLVDLHGQHDHQSLLHPERHVEFLDMWIGPEAQNFKTRTAQSYARWQESKQRLKAAQTGRRDREQRVDMLRFQIEEIETIGPIPGEMEDLENLLGRLTHAERIGQAAAEALNRLADTEGNAFDALAGSVRQLEDLTRFDASLEQSLVPLRDAQFAFQDGLANLRSYFEAIELDPVRLEETAARMDSLKRLRRKYGEDESAILEFLHQAQTELDLLEGNEATEDELLAQVEQNERRLMEDCANLTRLRSEKSKEFAALVQNELHDLAMENAAFAVAMQPKPPEPTGADDVYFQFSANAGEPSRALNKIASGGEISRVMLAIKSGLAGRAGVPTLIFDEVDAGLSGRAAATVAKKLEALGNHYQVIAISHLPQIASRAVSHFRIEKHEEKGRVRTDVRPLAQVERVEEIARMIGGDHLTESALQHAREMLGVS